MEELANWYPDTLKRGMMVINNSLKIEEKAKKLWDAGYLNALVPTDLIADGRLKINADGKPQIQNHEFDAVLFIAPQYARKSTLDFLKSYVDKGGKLMLDGVATRDFDGRDISRQWNEIQAKAICKSFVVNDIEKSGINKREFTNGVLNEDGSFTFTGIKDTQTLKSGKNGDTFTIKCNGLAAIKTDENGKLEKLVATDFSSLTFNGKTIIGVDQPTDISVVITGGKADIMMADKNKTNKVSTSL